MLASCGLAAVLCNSYCQFGSEISLWVVSSILGQTDEGGLVKALRRFVDGLPHKIGNVGLGSRQCCLFSSVQVYFSRL